MAGTPGEGGARALLSREACGTRAWDRHMGLSAAFNLAGGDGDAPAADRYFGNGNALKRISDRTDIVCAVSSSGFRAVADSFMLCRLLKEPVSPSSRRSNSGNVLTVRNIGTVLTLASYLWTLKPCLQNLRRCSNDVKVRSTIIRVVPHLAADFTWQVNSTSCAARTALILKGIRWSLDSLRTRIRRLIGQTRVAE